MDGRYSRQQNITSSPLSKNYTKAPRFLELELTERCNNSCVHCCINLPETCPEAQRNELTTDEWKKILLQAADIGVLTVRFTGGEPMLREDFIDLYLFARRLGLKVSIFTNACRITPEIARQFAHIPPLEDIEITVYGMHARTYEAVSCTRGSFSEFERGLQLLLEYHVPFVVKGALLPQNQSDMEEFENWAKSIPWMEKQPPSYSMFFDLRIRRESAARNQVIQKLRIAPEHAFNQYFSKRPGYRAEMKIFCQRFVGTQGENLFLCGGVLSGSVDPYGCLHHCGLLRDKKYAYDLRNGSLEEAASLHFPRLWAVKPENPDYLQRCAKCFLKNLCNQCPARSYIENGTLDTPVEYFCQIAHVQARYLGLLAEGEKAWEVTDGAERVKQMTIEEKPE